MKKRIFSFILALVMITTMLPVMTIEVEAANNIVINGVDIGYANGSYFTKNGGSCKDYNNYDAKGNAKDRCHNRSGYDCKKTTDPSCNCMRYWPTGNASTCQIDLMASQCFGFARYCQWKVYGTYDAKSPSSFKDITGDIKEADCTGNNLKSKLLNCAPATHVRTFEWKKGWGHSICIISTTDSGITFADCNSDGCCIVRYKTMSWNELATYLKGYGGIDYANSYTKNIPPATTPTPFYNPIGFVDEAKGGMQSVYIRGWAYDLDDTKKSLEIHVYIGGPAGSVNGQPGIIADKHRPGVDTAYGVGAYHGYEETIYTNLTGTQPVYIYAINVGGGENVLIEKRTVTITADKTAPVISDVKITNVDSSGFTVSCKVTDNVRVTKVCFPTWTEPKQDDIQPDWSSNTAAHGTKSRDTYTYRVKFSDHNNEKENYVTHIYAYDDAGNEGWDNTNERFGLISLTYDVTYDANGGSGAPTAQKKTYNTTLKLSTTKPTKSGAEFIGWNTKADGSGTAYASGAEYKGNAALKLYAQWKHVHKYSEKVTTPTCTEKGYTTYTCTCGDSYKDNYTNATGHSTELKNAKAATCTADGYTGDEICKTCGKTIKSGETIKAIGHKWDDGKITKEPTETTEGAKQYTCTVCKGTKEEAIPVIDHEHSYTDTVVAATCTEQGYTLHECACGESYKDTYTDALGHDTELKNTKSATCTVDGYTGDEICKVCGKTVKSGEAIKAIGHKWDDGKVTKEPTETSEGTKQYTCTVCEETKDEIIPIEIHIHTYRDTMVEPTCTEQGYTLHECTCGESYKDTYTDAIGHKWDDGEVIKEATETTTGTKRFTCSVCKETEDRIIPVIDHEHSFKDTVVVPTCTDSGYTLHECACGESYKDTYTDALGHDTELKNTKSATCTADGYTGDEICKTCGKTTKTGEVIKATDHKWNNGEVIKEATETTEGIKQYTCTVCNETKDEAIPVTTHKHSFKDTVVKPNCIDSGYTLHECACGESYKDTYTDAPGHDTEPKNAKAATCTVDGYTGDEICKTCGKTVKSGEVIKAAGHSYANGKCSVCGAADPDYKEPTPTPADNPFKDVKESDWFYNSVLWAVENGVTGGTSPTTFSPNNPCTRAQVVTFLWAANGKPEPTSMNNPFTDVSDNAWYCKAVMWAVENGITGGTSATTFSPDAYCTRAQVATFLYAAEGKPAVQNTINEFVDVPDNAWYLNPVLWAKENDITGGIGGGKFGPDQTCTRAQIATFLYKAMS